MDDGDDDDDDDEEDEEKRRPTKMAELELYSAIDFLKGIVNGGEEEKRIFLVMRVAMAGSGMETVTDKIQNSAFRGPQGVW